MAYIQNACKPKGIGGHMILNRMNRSHVPMAEWGYGHFRFEPTDSVLDIGCGGGANLAKILGLCPNGRADGVDYSAVSVKKSTKFNKEAIRAGRCSVVRGDVTALPHQDGTYDVVTAFETVYFWPQIVNAFRQVFRVLKPGGRFYICNETDGIEERGLQRQNEIVGMKVYNAGQFNQYLKEAGFTEIQTDTNEHHWLCVTAVKPTE